MDPYDCKKWCVNNAISDIKLALDLLHSAYMRCDSLTIDQARRLCEIALDHEGDIMRLYIALTNARADKAERRNNEINKSLD